MAAAEAAPDASGPRFAPDDPTLPEPWKGLIDGKSGMLYYWNQETNVTQYDRPPGSSAANIAPEPLPTQPTQQAMPYQNQFPNTVPPNSNVLAGIAQQQAGQLPTSKEQEMYTSPMPQQLSHQQVPPQQMAYPGGMPYQQGSPYMQGQPMQRPWGPQQHPYPHGQQPQQTQGPWVQPQNVPRPQISQQPSFPKPDEASAYDNNLQMGFGAPQMNGSLMGGPHPAVQPNQPLGGFAGPNQPPLVSPTGDDHMRRIAGGNDFHPQNIYPSPQPKLAPIPQSRPVNSLYFLYLR